MHKKMQVLIILYVVISMLLSVSGCENESVSNVANNENSSVKTESKNSGIRENPAIETTVPDEIPHNGQIVKTDLKPSEGFEFENSGDGTCTITGIGTCTDKEIIIPLESMPCILLKMLTALHC